MNTLAFFALVLAPVAIALIRYYLARRLEQRMRAALENDPDLVDEGKVSDTGRVR